MKKKPIKEALYLSKLDPRSYRLGFDSNKMIHIIKIFVKSPIDGVACNNCAQSEKTMYFCREENNFWCKTCCVHKHKPKTITNNPEHSDYLVEAIIEVK